MYMDFEIENGPVNISKSIIQPDDWDSYKDATYPISFILNKCLKENRVAC